MLLTTLSGLPFCASFVTLALAGSLEITTSETITGHTLVMHFYKAELHVGKSILFHKNGTVVRK